MQAREFVSVATCDFEGRPNAASKFLLKVDQKHVYLIDYIIGRTFQNLKINPRASISFLDADSLIGYQLNGRAVIIDSGAEFERILKELHQRQIDLSTKRIIEGVTKGKVHEGFEVSIPENFVILKFGIEEVVEMGADGIIRRQNV